MGENIPRWYINFQTAVLAALPTPPDIDEANTLIFVRDFNLLRKSLKKAFDLNPSSPRTSLDIQKFTIGGLTRNELINRVAVKYNINPVCLDIISHGTFSISRQRHEVEFVFIKVGLCGISGMPTIFELRLPEFLNKLSVDLCEPEDALYIRLGMTEQSPDTHDGFWIVTPPLYAKFGKNPKGRQYMFRIDRTFSGKDLFRASVANPGDRVSRDRIIVYRVRI